MTRAQNHRSPQKRDASSAAFTIVELLMSMAIIFILITAAAVALKGAKRSADRTQTMSALKQMVVAYNNYAGENEGTLLPGYIAPAMLGLGLNKLDIKAKLPNGEVLTPEDTASYVWRLAPYLDKPVETYMVDYRSSEMMDRYSTEYLNGIYGPAGAANELQIALTPSIGLNAIFLGGDSQHTDPALSHWIVVNGNIQVNPNTVAASRIAQVKSPGKIVVFAPTQGMNLPPGINSPVPLGYCELRPPYLTYSPATLLAGTNQWTIDAVDGSATIGMPILNPAVVGEAGLPADRLADIEWDGAVAKLRPNSPPLTIPIGHLDGSVEVDTIDRLSADMTRWSPIAVGVDKEWK